MIDYKKRAFQERRRKGKARYAAYKAGVNAYHPNRQGYAHKVHNLG